MKHGCQGWFNVGLHHALEICLSALRFRAAFNRDLTVTSLVRLMILARDLSVHGIRRQIDLAGPCDRAIIDEDLFEEPHVSERR